MAILKTLSKVGIESKLFNLIKSTDWLHNIFTVNDLTVIAFPCKWETKKKKKSVLLPNFTWRTNITRQEEIREIKVGKKESRLLLYSKYITAYKENLSDVIDRHWK